MKGLNESVIWKIYVKGKFLPLFHRILIQMISKILSCRRLKKSNAFVYEFKQHLFTNTLPGDRC